MIGGKILATVITGFLGAGKTTVLRHLIENAGGRRLAVIVNEFGAVGVDADLLRGCGIPACEDADIVELANGCLCCTVADEFLPAMQALLDRPDPPEHIVIETSGLALPKPLLKAFGWPGIRSRVTVDGVIAVVDGPAVAAGRFADDPDAVAAQRRADPGLDHDNPLAEVFEDQLQSADLVVLNKADLLDAGTLARVRATVAAGLPRAVRMVATWPHARRITTPRTARTSTMISRVSSWQSRRRMRPTRCLPGSSLLRRRTRSCASRASPRSGASRCAWRSRALAGGSARSSTAPGRLGRHGAGTWSSSARPDSTARPSRPA